VALSGNGTHEDDIMWNLRTKKPSKATKGRVKPKRYYPEIEQLEIRWLLSWTATGQHRTTDVTQATLVPFGVASLAPNWGAVRISHPLDFDKSPGTAVSLNPALIYNSETVSPRPILEAVLASDPTDAVPTSIDVRLTWNNGTPQAWVNFSTTGHSAGDDYLLAAQVNSAVASTGADPWTLELLAHFSGSPDVSRTVSGTASVVVRGSSHPFHPGWHLNLLAQLVSVSGGVMWVYGSGSSRYFASAGGGNFTRPANDFGTLVQNADNTYTYTAKDQVKWKFDSGGKLTSIVETHNLPVTFTYASGNLSTVQTPDGGLATLTYSGSYVDNIAEPGNRTVSLGRSKTPALPRITDVDGSIRDFGYDTNERLTADTWGPLLATYTYDSSTKLLSSANRGLGTTLNLTPAAARGLTTSPALNADQALALLTDANNQKTTLTLDALGRTTRLQTPDSALHTYTLDSAGQVTVYTDPLNRVTTMTYQYSTGKGDLTQIQYPDASTHDFQYDTPSII
jgi:hypothetical protein